MFRRLPVAVVVAALAAAAALSGCATGRPDAQSSRSISPAAPQPSATSISPSAGATSAPARPDSPYPPPVDGTGISGRTVLDRCPLTRTDPPCPDRPIAARLSVLDAATGKVITTVSTGNDGHFRVTLTPGRYLVRPEDVPGTPRRQPEPVPVTVTAGQYTSVTIRIGPSLR